MRGFRKSVSLRGRRPVSLKKSFKFRSGSRNATAATAEETDESISCDRREDAAQQLNRDEDGKEKKKKRSFGCFKVKPRRFSRNNRSTGESRSNCTIS